MSTVMFPLHQLTVQDATSGGPSGVGSSTMTRCPANSPSCTRSATAGTPTADALKLLASWAGCQEHVPIEVVAPR